MKIRFAGALVAFAFALGLAMPAAQAAPAPIQDGAGLFTATTVSQLDQKISDFTAQTGKEIVVVTVPSLNGSTVAQAAQSVFSSQDINGVLIFIAKAERADIIVPGRQTAQFFPESTNVTIRQAMESQFKDGDFDGGITTAVNEILNIFRAHLSSAPAAGSERTYPVAQQSTYAPARQGAHFPVWLFIILIVVGFLVLRSIFRAMSGPRYYGGPGAMPGPGGPGYGAGYGAGGYYGGGGSFWSGLLGGLGGAWLGNEMFGGNRGTTIIDNNNPGMIAGDQGGGWGGGDPGGGGWGSDAGQADMGNASGGDWSGGGFGDGGGGFGGGDSGGGW